MSRACLPLLVVALATSACSTTPPSSESRSPARAASGDAPEGEPSTQRDPCEPLPSAGDPCSSGFCPVNTDQYLECSDGEWHLITEFPEDG
ncbi:MAG: hypothetical protein H6713_29790 [Myxococcales bacterium]|nr:hypothetical protein [Myxococcales bacterium]